MKMISGTGKVAMALFAASAPALATVPAQVPEPSTILLVGGGIAALILIARKKRAGK